MSPRERFESEDSERGFGGFLRSLLHGIPWSERAEGRIQLKLDPPRSGELRVDNSNGRTEVLGEDRDDIEVRALTFARAETVEAAEKLLDEIRVVPTEVEGVLTLEVEIPRRWNRRGSAQLQVRVPRACRLEVVASNGKVCIHGMRAAVRARSSNGSVRVSDVVGDVEVETSNAKVGCSCTHGRLVARSSNGKIELSEHHGSIDASTSNGLIHVSLYDLGAEGIQLATSNGRIVLELPERVDADVDIRVDNGVIRNDRNLVDASRSTNNRVRGTLGRGGAPIRLRTSNGSICMR